jgi:hypothetical protein
MHAALKLPGGMDIGAIAYFARSGEVDGKKIWQVGSRTYAKVHASSLVTVSAEDFRPLSSWWKHTLLGEVTAEYGASEVRLQKADGSKPMTVPVEYPAYDNEQVVQMMRRLPLEVGYKAVLPIISTLGGGAGIRISLEVKARETVEVPAGKWECFEVLLMPVSQTFWISTDAHRYVTKFHGGGVNAELIAIEQRKAGAPVVFNDPAIGVTVTAPADWLIHKQDPDSDEDRTSIYLLDPKAQAENCMVRINSLESLSPTARSSARGFAEMSVESHAKQLKDLKVRPDSWGTAVVNGLPAVSFIADYIDNGKPMVVGGVYALGNTAGYQFNLAASPEEFGKMQPAFEGIVASFKATK